jgi:hypothetical protein
MTPPPPLSSSSTAAATTTITTCDIRTVLKIKRTEESEYVSSSVVMMEATGNSEMLIL